MPVIVQFPLFNAWVSGFLFLLYYLPLSRMKYCLPGVYKHRNTVEPPVSDHPKVQRFSGHLQEVDPYKSQTTGSLFWEQVWHIYLFEDNLLYTLPS